MSARRTTERQEVPSVEVALIDSRLTTPNILSLVPVESRHQARERQSRVKEVEGAE